MASSPNFGPATRESPSAVHDDERRGLAASMASRQNTVQPIVAHWPQGRGRDRLLGRYALEIAGGLRMPPRSPVRRDLWEVVCDSFHLSSSPLLT